MQRRVRYGVFTPNRLHAFKHPPGRGDTSLKRRNFPPRLKPDTRGTLLGGLKDQIYQHRGFLVTAPATVPTSKWRFPDTFSASESASEQVMNE